VPVSAADRCLILASDGLWNMMNNQAAVKVVQDFEQTHKPYLLPRIGELEQSHASQLLDVCMNRWSKSRYRADNTTVLTIMLDHHMQDAYLNDESDDEDQERNYAADSGNEDSEGTDSEDEMPSEHPRLPPPYSLPSANFLPNGQPLDYIANDYLDHALDDVDDDACEYANLKDSVKLIGDTVHSMNFEFQGERTTV